MKRFFLYTILSFFLLLPSAGQAPANSNDSIRLSLLTCAPGEEIYSLFGHTAIRYENPSQGIDVVFNYGLFSFNTPNFIFRFSLGETDYQLGVTDYEHFAAEYAFYGRSVWQQTLNLTDEEKTKLIQLLQENYRPENRVYRYNFFYDNCATRPRDKIEESIAGKVVYPTEPQDGSRTFRDIVHQYCKGHPWARFGIDLCIGSEADQPITQRQMMFAPFYLMDAFDKARIVNASENRPLVTTTKKIIDCEPDVSGSAENDIWNMLTPIRLSLLVFIAIGMATVYGLRKKKSLWGLDISVFAAAGIAGCIIAFLALFSEHPTVGSNYLLFVFHPGHLLCLPSFINDERKRRKSMYHLLNCIVLTLFIVLFPVIPQNFDLAVLPLALCLLIRSASNLILTYKKAK
jgi:hypothetical protein